jgi:phenylacetate-coenzyme A ligase PaaK-like adenylate-forming protein
VLKHNAVINIMDWPAFGLHQTEKHQLLLDAMEALTQHHENSCLAYSSIICKLWQNHKFSSLEDLPFLPVRLFKHERLISVSEDKVIKTMTSSGTSGQSVSQIFLDKQTSAMQIKVLSRIMGDFLGAKRLPMLVVDCRATVSSRHRFSARTAAILGFSMFGRDIEFALDDDMSLNQERVNQFLEKYVDQPILLFGFTFIVYLHFLKTLESASRRFSLKNAILIHGGGWKQLQSEAIDSDEFKSRLQNVTGINRIHNYYGMVEQTGSIFMECARGHLHASAWSEVIIRDPATFQALPAGQPGLIQLLSVIPHSYPGHSLLSEDEGTILGVDSCPCGRKGTFFRVLGRIQNAETRGCSDTYSR